MKNLIVTAVLSAALLFSITMQTAKAQTKMKSESSKTTTKVQYTCKMHPEVISDKPGKCPKCGMALVKKTDTSKKTTIKM